MAIFNQQIKQLLLLGVIIFLVFLAIKELWFFLPGLLGALTLYILSRANYFQLVYNRKWRRGMAALLYIFYYLVLIGLPIYLAVTLIGPKVDEFLSDPNKLMNIIKQAVASLQEKTGFNLISEESLSKSLNSVSEYIPKLLNSTATLISNLALMLFILYYMLYYCKEMERVLNHIIPLKQANINRLAAETKRMVKANALGIPLISLIQGIVATFGYLIFGVEDWGLWGFLTGLFAFFPVIGTMVIWVPLVVYMYAFGETWKATWVTLYCAIVVSQVDHLARMTILRRIGNVHPVITILGILIGLNLFGFVGLIFGPLLLSYIILLFRIYNDEFTDGDIPDEITNNNSVKKPVLPGVVDEKVVA